MNLHQFRFVREAVRQNFNLTEAAKALYTSQPGVSKAIIELEDELGVEIFTRHGKRVRSLTEPGRIILASVEKILQEVESLKRVGKDYAAQDQGNLVIAATHTQARYCCRRHRGIQETLPESASVHPARQPDAGRRDGHSRSGGHRHRHRSHREL